MAGYGNADDGVGAVDAHIEDSLALHKAKQEVQNNQTGICVDCDEPIDPARIMFMPGCRRCADCQKFRESQGYQVAKFKVRTGYMP